MKKILLAAVICFGTQAQAGLLLEPYIGYNFTAIETDAGEGKAAKGPILGGRVGWTLLGTVFVAFDYSTGDIEWDPENSLPKLDGTLTRMGITAGADIPIAPLRAWAGYYKSKFEPSESGMDVKMEDGKGVKIGLGLTFLPIIDINLEYFNAKYDNYKANGTVYNEEITDRGLMLSLSAPFDL